VEPTAARATQRPPCVGGGYAAVAGLFSQMLLETPSATMEPANESPPSMVGRGYRWLGEGYRFVTGPSVVNFKRPSDRAPHSSVGPLPCHQDVAEIFPQRAAPVPVKPGWRRRRLSLTPRVEAGVPCNRQGGGTRGPRLAGHATSVWAFPVSTAGRADINPAHWRGPHSRS
jgi:hypothetical protein